MVAGDFNCVASGLDVICGEAGSHRHGCVNGLAEVEQAFDLADAWRVLHPRSQELTHTACNGSGTSSARLDRVLVSSSLLGIAHSCACVLDYPGDHLGVTAAITLAKGPCKGPGCFRLPQSLLHQPGFVQLLRAEVQAFLADHPVVAGTDLAQR